MLFYNRLTGFMYSITIFKDFIKLYIRHEELHNQHIRHDEFRMIPLSGHLASCSDNDPKCFMFRFYKISYDSILDRKEKEKILYKQI